MAMSLVRVLTYQGKSDDDVITHAMPKYLLVDEMVHIEQIALSTVGDGQAEYKQEVWAK